MNAPTISTTAGAIRGVEVDGAISFRGIPYAGRVSGPGRFLPAPPAEAWTGVLDGTRVGPRAMQDMTPPAPDGPSFDPYMTGGRPELMHPVGDRADEDCLSLNVLTPAIDGARRPVMVYLHGGGFFLGSGSLATGAARFVLEQDVVLVSVNHRLNVFGFLELGHRDPRYGRSGNVGMLDIVDALRWVRAEIAAFGGDPDQVTIFGESGGGGKVCALLAMPAAHGLFARAIVESGPLVRAAERTEAAEGADRILDRLGAHAGDLGPLLRAPTDAILDAAMPDLHMFSPVVDGVDLPWHPFSPQALEVSSDVSVIIGYADEEMATLASRVPDDGRALHAWLTASIGDAHAERMIAAYRALRPAASVAELVLVMIGDAIHGRGSRQILQTAEARRAPMFSYLYARQTPYWGGTAAFHVAELPLALRLVLHPDMEDLSRQISAAWAAFARSGDPSTVDLAWPAFDSTTCATMLWDRVGRVESDPRAHRLRLWDDVPAATPYFLPGGWLEAISPPPTA